MFCFAGWARLSRRMKRGVSAEQVNVNTDAMVTVSIYAIPLQWDWCFLTLDLKWLQSCIFTSPVTCGKNVYLPKILLMHNCHQQFKGRIAASESLQMCLIGRYWPCTCKAWYQCTWAPLLLYFYHLRLHCHMFYGVAVPPLVWFRIA